MMPKGKGGTDRKAASDAAKTLKDPKAGKAEKSAAGAALSKKSGKSK